MSQERFFKTYANLPDPEREQVIVVIEGQPYSWSRARDEIEHGTKKGKLILQKLKKMGIL